MPVSFSRVFNKPLDSALAVEAALEALDFNRMPRSAIISCMSVVSGMYWTSGRGSLERLKGSSTGCKWQNRQEIDGSVSHNEGDQKGKLSHQLTIVCEPEW